METAQADVLEILQRACAELAPASLMTHDAIASVRGRCKSVSPDGLVLEFLERPQGRDYQRDARCIVTFPLKNVVRVFSALVRTNEEGDSEALAHVVLDLPPGIGSSESRASFRVPVPAQSSLRVAIRSASGEDANARALNISLGGLLMELTGEHNPGFEIGHRLTVALTLGAKSIELPAAVRRREDARYGLVFPQVFKEGELQPPDDLQAFMRVVEAELLRLRSRRRRTRDRL